MIAFASCKKEDSPSRSQLILGAWKPSFQATDDNSNNILDASERRPVTDSINLSGVYNFNAGGSGSLRASLPFTGDTTISFTWALYNGDQSLLLNFPNSTIISDTVKIHTLTSNEFILEGTDLNTNMRSWSGLKK